MSGGCKGSQEPEVRRENQKRKTKTLNHRGHRGAQRKNLFCHRFSLIGTDLRAKSETRESRSQKGRSALAKTAPGRGDLRLVTTRCFIGWGIRQSEFNSRLRADVVVVRMFYFAHLRYEIGGVHQRLRRATSGYDDVTQRRSPLENGERLFDRNPASG
jgi:hypothetical protein